MMICQVDLQRYSRLCSPPAASSSSAFDFECVHWLGEMPRRTHEPIELGDRRADDDHLASAALCPGLVLLALIGFPDFVGLAMEIAL